MTVQVMHRGMLTFPPARALQLGGVVVLPGDRWEAPRYLEVGTIALYEPGKLRLEGRFTGRPDHGSGWDRPNRHQFEAHYHVTTDEHVACFVPRTTREESD